MLESKDIYSSVGIAKEQLTDILDALQVEYSITCEYTEYRPEGANFYGITHFSGEINGIKYKTVDITYNPTWETAEGYINKVKAYLFCVLDGAANL